MPETLQSPSCILLYGRLVTDLNVGPNAVAAAGPPTTAPPVQPPHLGANASLQQQLAAPGATIARIYGFTYEGHYYDLSRPALFLVHGPGDPAGRILPGAAAGAATAPEEADKLGVAATAKSFPHDMMVWAYDKGDFSIRMDVQTGPFEQILLEGELSSEKLRMTFSGAKVRLRRNSDEED
jgi:hypothetical protein